MFRVMAFPLDFHSVSGDRKPRGAANGAGMGRNGKVDGAQRGSACEAARSLANSSAFNFFP